MNVEFDTDIDLLKHCCCNKVKFIYIATKLLVFKPNLENSAKLTLCNRQIDSKTVLGPSIN